MSDDQVIGMINARFDSLESTIKSSDDRVAAAITEVRKAFEEHTKQDASYWRRLDEQDAQISLIKWMTSGGAGTALLAWIYTHFGK